MSPHLDLESTSRAEDAAFRALADVASAAAAVGADYRVIGGHMVTLHAAVQPGDGPARGTLDADLGLESLALSYGTVTARLAELGYAKVGGNRFEQRDAGRASPSRTPAD